MIYSDRQYQVSQAERRKLQAALDATLANKAGEQEWLQQIEIDALRSQIAEIESELAEYDLLRRGKISFSETCSLIELPRVLVQARIAKGLTQTDLAEQLNMKPQQIQRYEATNYMSASLARLIEVADILGVKISESFEGADADIAKSAIFAWSDPKDVSWSRLPFKEMLKRKWLDVKPEQSAVEATRLFFIDNAGPQFATAMHRKKVRSGNVPNEFALLAWQARILGLAKKVSEAGRIKTFELNDSWMSDLVRLTNHKRGPQQARELLAHRGIILVIERHLPGTYLDGAAMLSGSGQPVVGLTLRYDRLDNFWFVLFHELGHIFLHLFDSLRFDFFDEEDGSKSDNIEQEADDFALNMLIPPEVWDRSLSRFALTEEAVLIDAQNLGIDPSIIAGRIRKERNNYLILNNLIGKDTVRSQLEVHDGPEE
jgi:HTH-type transcriptional regulator / antitoxin HigA